METKQYKAGRVPQILIAGSIIILILFVLVISIFRGWSIFLLTALFLAFLGLLKLHKLSRKPLFIVNENEIMVLNPLKKVAIGKITAIREEGQNRLELVLKNEMPVPLFIGELSKIDRKDLKARIENLIGMANK
jgi:hypothetical protein